MMQTDLPPGPKFNLGRCCITSNALSHLAQDDVFRALQRHQSGDWGDVDNHDRQENELSLGIRQP